MKVLYLSLIILGLLCLAAAPVSAANWYEDTHWYLPWVHFYATPSVCNFQHLQDCTITFHIDYGWVTVSPWTPGSLYCDQGYFGRCGEWFWDEFRVTWNPQQLEFASTPMSWQSVGPGYFIDSFLDFMGYNTIKLKVIDYTLPKFSTVTAHLVASPPVGESLDRDAKVRIAPEFPSPLLPVISTIGFLGAVLFIKRIREH